MHGEGFLRKKFVVINFLFLLFRKFSVLILQKIVPFLVAEKGVVYNVVGGWRWKTTKLF